MNENAVKLMVFALSAFFTGLAGAFYVHYVGGISQKTLGLDFFILLMVMLFVGGLARYPGAVVGALVFTFVNQYLNALEEYRMIVLGIMIAASIELMPQGFVGALEDLVLWLRRRRSPDDDDSAEQAPILTPDSLQEERDRSPASVLHIGAGCRRAGWWQRRRLRFSASAHGDDPGGTSPFRRVRAEGRAPWQLRCPPRPRQMEACPALD